MDIQSLTNLVSSVGFPIAMTCYLLYNASKNQEKMSEAINNNTLALTELKMKLEEERGKYGNQET